jgi:hypothetical protein
MFIIGAYKIRAEIDVMLARPAIVRGLEVPGSDGKIRFEGVFGVGVVGEKSLSFGKIRLDPAFERKPINGRKKGFDLSACLTVGSEAIYNIIDE